ncbi:MAG: hypothetical protein K2O14_11555 [Oscillospiraceae bacterium]|nr:hypothetical protein [Oscillospiraceae bacterium]
MKSSNKKNTVKPLPRIFRKPMIPASVLLALDILTLAAAAVLNATRGRVTERYFYADGVISSSAPYSWFGIAAAALMITAAAIAALIIAGAFLGRRRNKSEIVFEAVAAVLLLALSAGAAGFSLYIVNGEQPRNIVFTSFTDEENQLVFAEEQYRNENLLKIYFVGGAPEENECVRLVCVELKELSQGKADERYTVQYISEHSLLVGFSDGTAYRTLELKI